MRSLSNLPPGCTDRDIEIAAGAYEDASQHARRVDLCPKCGSKLLRAPYVIVCESVTCDYDARSAS
jgi:hypothetical protein